MPAFLRPFSTLFPSLCVIFSVDASSADERLFPSNCSKRLFLLHHTIKALFPARVLINHFSLDGILITLQIELSDATAKRVSERISVIHPHLNIVTVITHL